MRPRELKFLLKDVQDAIQQIERFTLGMTLAEYEGAELVQRGVERDFGIIGEAINRMRRVSNEVSVRVDEAVKISGFRNVLAHEYEIIDQKRVWLTAQKSRAEAANRRLGGGVGHGSSLIVRAGRGRHLQ